MHELLTHISEELLEISREILQFEDKRPLNNIHGNFQIAGVTFEELALRAGNLSIKINNSARTDIPSETESRLSPFTSALIHLRQTTIPQINSGNANFAVPAFTITLDSLERILTPLMAINGEDLLSIESEYKTVRDSIRSLIARTNSLDPEVQDLQSKANVI